MAGVITASEPSWIAPFTGLSPRQFTKLVTALRREGTNPVRRGRPWGLPLEDRVLLVAAYWRTNLTLRQLAPLFGVSKSAADRIIAHLGPPLAPQPGKRFRRDIVLIVDGTLVPTRDHRISSAAEFGGLIAGRSAAELAEPFTFVVGTDGVLRMAPTAKRARGLCRR